MDLRKTVGVLLGLTGLGAVVGTLIGLVLGLLGPALFTAMMPGLRSSEFDPVRLGISLGLVNGFIYGFVGGIVVALLHTWYRIRLLASQGTEKRSAPDRASAECGGAGPPDPAGIRGAPHARASAALVVTQGSRRAAPYFLPLPARSVSRAGTTWSS